ncbi:hypothetical protein LEP1GSC021_0297 [Leptospira noguchii str. 1993005606]|nr:hypothetical protein LEP1GSC021_0297 [Leptospira noguchii str. 1993005606]
MKRFLRKRLKLSTTLSYGSRWKLSVSLPMGRSTGREPF